MHGLELEQRNWMEMHTGGKIIFLSVIDIWITNCQSVNLLEPYTHQEINTDPVDLDKFRFVQPLDIANICHDRHNQRLCTFFELVPLCTANAECWPILANLGYFVVNIYVFLCAFKGVNYAVVHQT